MPRPGLGMTSVAKVSWIDKINELLKSEIFRAGIILGSSGPVTSFKNELTRTVTFKSKQTKNMFQILHFNSLFIPFIVMR